ncbi:MAG: hypothetical protein AB7E79_09390 [Rhodospirillaceae bacterium]
MPPEGQIGPDDIGRFFSSYAGAFNRALAGEPDLTAVAAHFTGCFIESRAGGVTCGKDGPEFLRILEKGCAYDRSIGTKARM